MTVLWLAGGSTMLSADSSDGFRWGPMGSDWVISHTVETAIDKTINLHSLTTMSPTDVDTHLANKERPNKICRIRYKVAESLTNSI